MSPRSCCVTRPRCAQARSVKACGTDGLVVRSASAAVLGRAVSHWEGYEHTISGIWRPPQSQPGTVIDRGAARVERGSTAPCISWLALIWDRKCTSAMYLPLIYTQVERARIKPRALRASRCSQASHGIRLRRWRRLSSPEQQWSSPPISVAAKSAFPMPSSCSFGAYLGQCQRRAHAFRAVRSVGGA